MSHPEAQQIWGRACKHLEQALHHDVYSRWIAVIQPVSLDDHTLTLGVENDFYQSWLEENYVPLIKQALSAVSGETYDILFAVREGQTPPAESKPVEKRRPLLSRLSRSPRLTAALNPRFTFDSFIIGPSNSFAHAAALAVAQAPARAYNPLFIYGGVGLGKTHIMQAIGHHVQATSRSVVCYVSSEALLNEYIEALQSNSLVQFRKKYRFADLLLVDDIHFLAGKERIQEEFFHTFNALFDSRKQIVMTSDRPASEIARLEQRLVSRFEWGLVTELEPPDLETRVAILREKQKPAAILLPDEFLHFIAQNVKSNIRRLEGALVRALSYASLTGKDITMDALRHLLRDLLDEEHAEEITFDRIQRTVAEHFDLRLTDMTSKRRPRSVAMPRQIAMYLCRRMTRSSLPDIANAFGKTHATVLHACKAVESRMDVDGDLRGNVMLISKKLGARMPFDKDVKKADASCS
ncbi:MAG: chromosomal replication initiator protein DnaA [Lentisphaerae bacterium]|nr:chromosomal replication initiator protein DnaA [Lentisphaerota bacterium]